MKKIIIEKNIINNVVSEYKKGTSIPILNKKYGINTKKISQLLKENNVEIRGRRKFFYNENFFEDINSKLKAYWLGFLFADGCVRDIKKGYVLKIKLSHIDEEHLINFNKHIGNYTGELRIETSKFKSKNGKEYQSTAKVLLINSKKIVKDLIKHGCYQNKTNIIEFPNIDSELIPSFILGYFDGDGCITQKKVKNGLYYNVTFTSGSENFLNRVREELINFGIKSVSKYSYKTFHRLQISNKIDLLKLKTYFYNNNEYCLNRKKIKFDYV
jgi:hypothetical protein